MKDKNIYNSIRKRKLIDLTLTEKFWKSLYKSKKGVTLVELIVVITIISILGAIAFISFQWYSSKARDSVRIKDTSSIKTALDMFYMKTSKYPFPSDPLKTVTYSWGIAFYEGTFWESAFRQVQVINKYLKDPLFQEVYYTYSITNNKKQYQIWYITENSITHTLPIINTTFASSYITKINWIYSWSILVSTGWIKLVYTTPTIITSYNSSGTYDIESLSGTFVINWWSINIPFSYLDSLPKPPASIDIIFAEPDGIIITCPDCIVYP
jgi:prepilin-type N-terminal cleavage/methylation domain-containing protein